MATPFNRSIRSLQGDGSRSALLGLLLTMLMLIVWLAWFVLAKVTVYEFSQRIQTDDEGLITADFPASAQGRIKRGQAAYLRLDGNIGPQVGPIPAIVTEVENFPKEERVQAKIVVFWRNVPNVKPQAGLTGKAEIEVETISPATMALRAAGFLVKKPAIQVSPQETGVGN